MNWVDVEVVGINDMTFTRYETKCQICVMACQDGFRTSIIYSGTCGCRILQSNGELAPHTCDGYHDAESKNGIKDVCSTTNIFDG